MSKTYSSDNIKVLSDREHIQLRKAMYIGEAADPRTLLSEIIDNALDECQAGYSEAIVVSIDTKKHIYEVRDYGRGIPHGKKELNGEMKETLEILLTKSNSGGKFDNSAYTCSSGLHGLGLTITNALSKHICITSYRKGKYVKGEAFGTDDVTMKYGKTEEPDGTHVVFEPDAKFFPSVDIPLSFVKDRCRIASALGFRTRLIVDGEEVDTNATMFDLMKEDDQSISTYVQIDPITVISSNNETMKVAIKYTSETNDRYFGYTNLLVNYLGGTHVQELSKTIISTWKEFIEKHKNIKPAVDLHNNDFLVGLRAVCAVFINNPEFSSQTKEKLVVNKKYFEELMDLFSKKLYKYLHDNADIAHQLVKRFEEYRIAQNALLSRKEISSLIKINEESGDNIRRRSVVSKLIDCTSKKRDNTELFLCLAGDTKVKLATGQSMYIKDLVGKENVWLYSTNQFGNFIQAKMIRAFKTRDVNKLLRIHFFNGTYIDCTPEHKFMEKNTLIWFEAQNLRRWHEIHAMNAELRVDFVEELDFYESVPVYCLEIDSDEHSFVLANGAVTHNCEGNSACLRWDTMIRLANDTEATIKDVCERVNNGEIIYVYGKPPKGKPNTGPNICRVLAGGITRKNALLWRVYFDNGTYVDCTDDHKFMLKDRSFKEAVSLTIQEACYSLTCNHKQIIETIHRVVKIECLNIYEDVYDIEVEDVHNFCLANDVIVHNCGPYLYTRNKELQAILPLRGKILNVTFKSIKEAVQNSEICDIANSIGAGIGASCDASKSRYDKIIIAADADVDGQHITSLIASLFINLFPDLVKAGRVWISLPPLYCWGKDAKTFGWAESLDKVPKNVKEVLRFKGLGAMNPDQLKYFCVDPETRRDVMLEYPSDIDEFNRIVGSSQGKNELLKELGIIEEGR